MDTKYIPKSRPSQYQPSTNLLSQRKPSAQLISQYQSLTFGIILKKNYEIMMYIQYHLYDA